MEAGEADEHEINLDEEPDDQQEEQVEDETKSKPYPTEEYGTVHDKSRNTDIQKVVDH